MCWNDRLLLALIPLACVVSNVGAQTVVSPRPVKMDATVRIVNDFPKRSINLDQQFVCQYSQWNRVRSFATCRLPINSATRVESRILYREAEHLFCSLNFRNNMLVSKNAQLFSSKANPSLIPSIAGDLFPNANCPVLGCIGKFFFEDYLMDGTTQWSSDHNGLHGFASPNLVKLRSGLTSQARIFRNEC